MLTKLSKLKNKKGFTLIELVVVIAIIAVLATVLIPVIGSYVADANAAAVDEARRTIKTNVDIEITDMGNKGAIIVTPGTVIINVDHEGVVSVDASSGGMTFGSLDANFPMTYAASDADIAGVFEQSLLTRCGSLKQIGTVTTYTAEITTLNGQCVVAKVTSS